MRFHAKQAFVVCVVIALTILVITVTTSGSASAPRASAQPKPTTPASSAPAVFVDGVGDGGAAAYGEQLAVFLEDLHQQQVTDVVNYVAAVHAAEVAAAATRPSSSVTIRPSNNGAHSDAWWQGVSVCEQGGRNDSYFGYFSIMDGSAGGLDWATQVAMANAIIARAGDGAWAASCQAAGYAASPGG